MQSMIIKKEIEDMVKLVYKISILFLIINSFLFNQEIIINSIEIQGLVTASEKQIFRLIY